MLWASLASFDDEMAASNSPHFCVCKARAWLQLCTIHYSYLHNTVSMLCIQISGKERSNTPRPQQGNSKWNLCARAFCGALSGQAKGKATDRSTSALSGLVFSPRKPYHFHLQLWATTQSAFARAFEPWSQGTSPTPSRITFETPTCNKQQLDN